VAVTSNNAVRAVIEGVPQVGFYCGGVRCPEDVPFPSCLRACLEYLGDGVRCQEAIAEGRRRRHTCCYGYIMGTSGAAFRLLWNPDRWDAANTDLMSMAEDPTEPFRRAFDAVGYEFLFTAKNGSQSNEEEFRRIVIESIRDRKRPVLAFGVVGPPECCIVTGYDEGGDVLIGWSFFQAAPEYAHGVDFEASGYFRKRGWYADTVAVLALGERHGRPEPELALRTALEWALEVVKTPSVCGRHNGHAAYEAWAEALLRDDDFPAGDLAVLRERHLAHNDAVGTVAEGRWYASRFLMDMAMQVPAAARHLLAAAGNFEAEHDLIRKLWALQGGNGWDEAFVRKLAEPEVRRDSAKIIGQAREKDLRAVEFLERALGA